MFRRPGESPLQAAMRNSREQAQANWQRNMQGKYWQDHQQKPVYKPLPGNVPPLSRRQRMPSATIREVQAEFDVQHQDIDGMDIHLTFWVSNASNRTFTAAAHFFAAGMPLRDVNGNYAATDGTVCVWRTCEKRQVYIGPQNIVLFMPYAELHMGTGNHDLGFIASIWDDRGKQLAASDLFPFTLQVG